MMTGPAKPITATETRQLIAEVGRRIPSPAATSSASSSAKVFRFGSATTQKPGPFHRLDETVKCSGPAGLPRAKQRHRGSQRGIGVTDIGLGAKLAEGACAEVYEWGADGARIVKLAKPNTNLFALEREQRLSDIAWRLGLPVPRAHGLVQVDGRDGIVFDRAAGDTILKRFAASALATTPENYAADPEADVLFARTTAQLLFQIHSQTAEDVPPQHASLERDIRRNPHLSAAHKDAVMAWLDGLPIKRQLCHGDPNPGNILLDGETASIIDWNNATLGNPEADLAEYVLMIRYASLPSGTPPAVARLFEAARARSIRLFLDEYERLSGLGFADIDPWLAPIAARKLAVDGITEAETRQLIAEVERSVPADALANATAGRGAAAW